MATILQESSLADYLAPAAATPGEPKLLAMANGDVILTEAQHSPPEDKDMARPKTDQADVKVNKSEMVRQALGEHPDKGPKEIAALLGERGIEVTPGLVSMIKSKSKASKGKPGRKPGRKPGPKPAAAAVAASAGNGVANGLVAVEDVVAVRELARRLGTENLKRLADALGD